MSVNVYLLIERPITSPSVFMYECGSLMSAKSLNDVHILNGCYNKDSNVGYG